MTYRAQLDLIKEGLAVAAAAPRVGRDLGALLAAPAHALDGVRGRSGSGGGEELAANHLDVPRHARHAETIVGHAADGACGEGTPECCKRAA